jgi:hypothetical protein
MFEAGADHKYLQELEKLIREWVDLVHEEPVPGRDFQSFKVGP